MISHKKHILIVEDDSSTQALYSAIMAELYQLSAAHTVREAKIILRDEKIDLAIIDLALPGASHGLELIEFIRKENSDKKLPIITVTAHTAPADMLASLSAGSDEYLKKPIIADLLLSTIKKYIG